MIGTAVYTKSETFDVEEAIKPARRCNTTRHWANAVECFWWNVRVDRLSHREARADDGEGGS